MKRKNQSKGISPLIAAVLLIAFTVAIATLIAGWFSTLARSTTATVSNRTDQSVNCAGASITIDQVYATVGNMTTARAIVRNNGLADLSVVGAVSFNTTGINFTSSTSLPVTLNRGNVTTLSFLVNLSGCPGAFSKTIVTTSCGGVGVTFDSTPKCV